MMSPVIESPIYTDNVLNQSKIIHQQRAYLPMNQLISFANYKNQPHKPDLFCFQCCSAWTLSLTSAINKKCLSSCDFFGKLHQPMNSMVAMAHAMPREIIGYLPVDLSKNQRFVLDPSQPKMNLNLVFDLSGQSNYFTNLNTNYSLVLFDINLIGEMHGIQILKESIDFKVKGYDIQKSITCILNEKGMNLCNIVTRDQIRTVFNAVVFSNIQCTFAIEFSITNYNLGQYYSMMEKACLKNGKSNGNMMSICNYGIIINKLKIVYNLPLCVFSQQNFKGVIQLQKHYAFLNRQNQYIQEQRASQILQHQSYLKPCTNLNQTSYVKQQPASPQTSSTSQRKLNNNFCNWHSFMTCSTPMVFDTEELRIQDILACFIKPSLFGVRCIFKNQNNNYSQVNYFPSLSSISIEFVSKSHLNTSDNHIAISPVFQINDVSISEESFLTHSNSTNDDYSHSPSNKKKCTYYYEKTQELFNMKSYREQLDNFYKSHPNCEDLTLGDISSKSWFSITWTPSKSFQSKGFHEDTEINWNHSSSFKVYYQFRDSTISNSGHYLPVIGLLEKNIRGKTVDTSSQQLINFWFTNLSTDVTSISQLENNKKDNMQSYYSLLEKGCKFDY